MERASFITVEDGDDLIVSFAVPGDGPLDVNSMTLIRTPKYELLLPYDERGVYASYDGSPGMKRDMLTQVQWIGQEVRIICLDHEYVVDVRGVDDEEISEAQRVLKKMNFDDRFALRIVRA